MSGPRGLCPLPGRGREALVARGASPILVPAMPGYGTWPLITSPFRRTEPWARAISWRSRPGLPPLDHAFGTSRFQQDVA